MAPPGRHPDVVMPLVTALVAAVGFVIVIALTTSAVALIDRWWSGGEN